jgi:transcriptional regulator with XRE-family HTH domain
MPDRSGQVIDNFRLLRVLGEGAAGQVYLATPTVELPFASPGDPVAIKLYKPEILSKPGQRERIEREFRVGAGLAHPHLVRMFAYSIADADPYLVMEYVDGVSLDDWLTMFHPVSSRLRVRIAAQLTDALIELHRHEVQHRDVKPQNIVVSSTFDVKLMDLGVVTSPAEVDITPSDEFVGTIRNAAPEFLFSNDYDERADLYSLGTVFFALLHGEQVFADETRFSVVVECVGHNEPIFDETLHDQDPLASGLLQLTRHLVSKSPEDRPQTAEDVQEQLTSLTTAIALGEASEPLHGYIATALTGLQDDAREAIQFTSNKIAEVAKSFQIYVYQPRKKTDPLLHEDVTPDAVYRQDRDRVLTADILLVLANKPSFGVGQELEIAASHSQPTILISREGMEISRMVRGSFANVLSEIAYSTPEDLERKLRRAFLEHIDALRRWKNARPAVRLDIADRLRTLREGAGYSTPEEFAKTIGVSGRMIAAIERGDFENVGVQLLATICSALGTALHQLVGSDAIVPVHSAHDANLRRLEELARSAQVNISARDFLELRDEYLSEPAASGVDHQVTFEDWTARFEALVRRHLAEAEQQTLL